MPENAQYQPIKIEEQNELIIWGIVTYAIKQMK
jgi:DNA polymerase V